MMDCDGIAGWINPQEIALEEILSAMIKDA